MKCVKNGISCIMRMRSPKQKKKLKKYSSFIWEKVNVGELRRIVRLSPNSKCSIKTRKTINKVENKCVLSNFVNRYLKVNYFYQTKNLKNVFHLEYFYTTLPLSPFVYSNLISKSRRWPWFFIVYLRWSVVHIITIIICEGWWKWNCRISTFEFVWVSCRRYRRYHIRWCMMTRQYRSRWCGANRATTYCRGRGSRRVIRSVF